MDPPKVHPCLQGSAGRIPSALQRTAHGAQQRVLWDAPYKQVWSTEKLFISKKKLQ